MIEDPRPTGMERHSDLSELRADREWLNSRTNPAQPSSERSPIVSDEIWDDPEIIPSSTYVKFAEVGDSVSGKVTAIARHRFDDGNLVPQLSIATDDGQDVTLTAGQTRLKLALAEQRPAVGDHLAVKLTQIEKRAGGKTLKHFDVKVTRPPDGNKPPF